MHDKTVQGPLSLVLPYRHIRSRSAEQCVYTDSLRYSHRTAARPIAVLQRPSQPSLRQALGSIMHQGVGRAMALTPSAPSRSLHLAERDSSSLSLLRSAGVLDQNSARSQGLSKHDNLPTQRKSWISPQPVSTPGADGVQKGKTSHGGYEPPDSPSRFEPWDDTQLGSSHGDSLFEEGIKTFIPVNPSMQQNPGSGTTSENLGNQRSLPNWQSADASSSSSSGETWSSEMLQTGLHTESEGSKNGGLSWELSSTSQPMKGGRASQSQMRSPPQSRSPIKRQAHLLIPLGFFGIARSGLDLQVHRQIHFLPMR